MTKILLSKQNLKVQVESNFRSRSRSTVLGQFVQLEFHIKMAEQNWQGSWSFSNPASGASSEVDGPTYNVDLRTSVLQSGSQHFNEAGNVSVGEKLQGISAAPQTAASTYPAQPESPSNYAPTQDEFQFVASSGGLFKGLCFLEQILRFYGCFEQARRTTPQAEQHLKANITSRRISPQGVIEARLLQ